ncbi:hypothetical protein E2C01_029501 [Portunus trituberculatus]|uniref:Uncharacterized protein n=1 Tax=Portunus trituberculatus TaxID=210409 RepID=A0A5B7ES46_PORTR|nr:hypothetical protein [Portunus trituberculatus]
MSQCLQVETENKMERGRVRCCCDVTTRQRTGPAPDNQADHKHQHDGLSAKTPIHLKIFRLQNLAPVSSEVDFTDHRCSVVLRSARAVLFTVCKNTTSGACFQACVPFFKLEKSSAKSVIGFT